MQKILGELDPEQEKVRCLSCSALALAPPPPATGARARLHTPSQRRGAGAHQSSELAPAGKRLQLCGAAKATFNLSQKSLFKL